MSEKPFLERWAGRKAAARKTPEDSGTEAPAEVPDAPGPASAPQAAPDTAEPAQAISEEELAALPPVDSLTAGSDIRAFLRPGVPAALKNAALRRMWLVTPAIRDHKDVAVDYAWDWNTPGGVPGDGGRLDPERVAQWVREIAGDRKPEPPTGVPAASAARAPAATPNESVASSCRTAGAAKTADTAPPPASARENRHAATDPAPRPRHGGARPS